MPRYMLQFSYTPEAVKAMVRTPQDRRAAGEKLVAAAGGELIDFYFCFGGTDGVLIAEFPSNVDAASASLAADATGAFSRMETTVLIPVDEAMEAMEKARLIASDYKPPV